MTIQSRHVTTNIDNTITEAPTRAVAQSISTDQVIIVLDGSKKAEQVLPHAIRFTREQDAELVVVHTYKSGQTIQAQDHAKLYIKSIKNKMLAQYGRVIAFLYEGTNTSAALQSVLDDNKQTCIMVMNEKRNWLQGLLQGSMFAELAKHENVQIHEVAD